MSKMGGSKGKTGAPKRRQAQDALKPSKKGRKAPKTDKDALYEADDPEADEVKNTYRYDVR